MHGDDSVLFRRYVKGRRKAIFPWSLSIVDCFFISGALTSLAGSVPSRMLRISDEGNQVEEVDVSDSYDMYEVDTGADGAEVVLLHQASGSACYWDIHERFVVVTGAENFLEMVRPYPDDIERHRYVEAMLGIERAGNGESPEEIYEALSADVRSAENES